MRKFIRAIERYFDAVETFTIVDKLNISQFTAALSNMQAAKMDLLSLINHHMQYQAADAS